jgi:cytochrome b561
MASVNTQLRYGNVAMTFHWLIAAFIATNLALGFYFANVMSSHDPGFFAIIQLHKSVGLTVLVLSVLRLCWRLINPIPSLPVDFGIAMRLLARGTHFLFYFLMVAVPLAGWALVSASPLGIPTLYFGLFQWPHIPFLAELPRALKRPYTETFGEIHALLAYAAAALLVLHAGAALWHHYARRDDVLKRMVPGTKVAST